MSTGSMDEVFCTYNGMVDVLAKNTPHALVQDCWRRVELAIRDLLDAAPKTPISKLIPRLSEHLTPALIHDLEDMRSLRNEITHGPASDLTRQRAEVYAYRALEIIGAIARAQDKHGA